MWGFQKKEVVFGGHNEKDDTTVEYIVFPGLWQLLFRPGGLPRASCLSKIKAATRISPTFSPFLKAEALNPKPSTLRVPRGKLKSERALRFKVVHS